MLLTDSASLPFPDSFSITSNHCISFPVKKKDLSSLLGSEDKFHTAQAKLHIMVENSLNHCG